MKELPDFRTPEFLRAHVLSTMAFYDGRCVDPSGGFFQFFKDDGTIYDRHTRHLVGSARFIVTHAWAMRRFPTHERAPAWRDAVEHGLRFLRRVHHDPRHGGYDWLLKFDQGRKTVLDDSQRAYGLAFVLLAQAQALQSGIDSAAEGLASTFTLLERHFWEPEHGLYADEATPEWRLAPYRGQNANMHACEALLAAFEATGETPYLRRAATIAESLVQRLAAPNRGLIWEHYKADWTPDWDYHRDDKTDIFRPWGYQVGHLAEWARLLLALERLTPGLDDENWMQHRARQLFAAAVEHGWDRPHHGGLVYGFAPDGTVCDSDKYWWVQAEAIGAAAALAERTGEGGYWDWYDRLWAYAWQHFVDHEHGAWHRQLSPDNRKLDDNKSPAGKVDYHTMGACYEALDALERTPVVR
jgi:mannose/cellobiose epimerase-like protein (N-acyl-D-glucosamine 2-epimerase family)